MTKQTRGGSNAFDINGMVPFAGFGSFNGKLMECYVRAGQGFVTSAATLNREMMRFAGERFRADVKALQALSRCKDWSELAQCQSAYARSAAEAYQAEASKLTKLGTEAATSALKPLEEAAETMSGD